MKEISPSNKFIVILLIVLILAIASTGVLFFWLRSRDSKETETKPSASTTVAESARQIPEDKLYTSRFGSLWRMSKPIETVEYGWIRPHPGPFIWGQIEKTKGNYDWSEADEYVQTLQDNGNSILATVWPYADWDQEQCNANQEGEWTKEPEFHVLGDKRFEPCDYEQYSEWLSLIVERYDGDGKDDMYDLRYPVRHWEVLNEPELRVFYMGKAEYYIDILKASHKSIKSADPNAKVLLGGYAHGVEHSPQYWGEIFPEIDGYFDIATLHCLGQDDEDLWAKEYRAVLDSFDLDNEFWITEVSVGPEYEKKESHEDEIIAVSNAFANGAEKVFNGDGTTFIRYLDSFDSVERIADNIVKYTMPEESEIYALWDNAEVPENISDGAFEVIDSNGKILETEKVNEIDTSVPILLRVIK